MVLWIITAASVVALGVTLGRWWTFRRANIDSEGLLGKLSQALDHNDIDAAIALCSEAGGPVGETLGIGLANSASWNASASDPKRSRRASWRPWRNTAATC